MKLLAIVFLSTLLANHAAADWDLVWSNCNTGWWGDFGSFDAHSARLWTQAPCGGASVCFLFHYFLHSSTLLFIFSSFITPDSKRESQILKNSMWTQWDGEWGADEMESGNPCNWPDTIIYIREGNEYRMAVKARPDIPIGRCWAQNNPQPACNQWNYLCLNTIIGWCQTSYCHWE